MRSAPTLNIWMTPLASVAMLEKLALLKMALWSAPAFTIDSSVCPCAAMRVSRADLLSAPASVSEVEMGYPNLMTAVTDCQFREAVKDTSGEARRRRIQVVRANRASEGIDRPPRRLPTSGQSEVSRMYRESASLAAARWLDLPHHIHREPRCLAEYQQKARQSAGTWKDVR